IELGQLTSECKVTDINALLADVHSSFAQTAKNKGIHLEQLGDSISPMNVAGSRVRQIVANLVDNGIKYTAEGGTVSIRTTVNTDQQLVEIEVADTGEGVHPEMLTEIFLPFERGGQSHVPGVGLGLAISKSLADALGFDLSATSSLGKGSSFVLKVPIVEDVVAEEIASSSTAGTDDAQSNGLVLIVDDSRSSREIVRRILGRQGLRAEEACNGQEAVERCRQSPIPNLVIMDIRMPIMDGIEATTRIRQELDDDCPPILGLTGNLLDQFGDKLDGECFDDVLAKPFKLQDLLKMVREHLVVSK
ncbi:MAG: ATP-binding protein, partial [Planctomycetota bacterium]